jgi:hypothetical protein
MAEKKGTCEMESRLVGKKAVNAEKTNLSADEKQTCDKLKNDCRQIGQKRIQGKRTKGWRMPANAVYVGRGTAWGNMFRVGEKFSARAWGEAQKGHIIVETGHADWEYRPKITPEISVELFRHAVELQRLFLGEERFEKWIGPLRGKDLVCWCPLDQPCHADVLLELANRKAVK